MWRKPLQKPWCPWGLNIDCLVQVTLLASTDAQFRRDAQLVGSQIRSLHTNAASAAAAASAAIPELEVRLEVLALLLSTILGPTHRG